ncbi:MAG: cyclopropane-fatty-acyl-phospholipid synthase family protein [Acidimicrobiales bacterium]
MVTEVSKASNQPASNQPASVVVDDDLASKVPDAGSTGAVRSGPSPGPSSGRGGGARGGAPSGSAADALVPLIRALVGSTAPVRFEFWDGSSFGPPDSIGTLQIRSVDALRRILWAPGEMGVARAFVSGDLAIEGDIYALLRVLHAASPRDLRRMGMRTLPTVIDAARRLGALGPPLPAPPEECKPPGRLHSPSRDAAVISHHYDVGNEFYRLVLGPSMTYSCARFLSDDVPLEDAQAAKHELICRKLGLDQRPGARLLDVGCGWGSMAIHAARHHQAAVTGVALSHEQVEEARRRVERAGLADRVEIRLQDYRDLRGEQFDAISSIGMFEHVGRAQMTRYFETLRLLLTPTGRLLNHAISKPGGSFLGGRTFIGRYVFPDGELLDVADVIGAMQRNGFEVRDVESLREHYSRTLHHWVANLEAGWDEAVGLVGAPRANIWRLYMAASANGFDDGGLAIHQVLGVVPDAGGGSGMPPGRAGWG